MYRCPGNDYNNTIRAKEAKKLGCKTIEGAPITVIQTTKPRAAAGALPAAAAAAAGARVDPAAQRARDSDARRILEDELRTEEERLAALQKEYNDGQPERQGNEKNYQKYLDRVAEMRAAIERKQIDIAAIRRELEKLPPPRPSDRSGTRRRRRPARRPRTPRSTCWRRWSPSSARRRVRVRQRLLRGRPRPVAPQRVARLGVRLVRRAAGLSRDGRRGQPQRLLDQPARGRPAAPRRHGETLPVHVTVNQIDGSRDVVVELVEIEQQTRQEREERALEQAQATKELIRNLAHEIKNPLGGIRGAAQLLEMEVESRALTEYTQVIIKEADRLQGLVDRLLAPHRKPHVVGNVNIHEVCERVRALILAEFPRGLETERDYDISIPEFRGDREQLIQAVLNIAHNAAQALAESHRGRRRADHRCAPASSARSRSASTAIAWHWNCISRTTAPAFPSPSASGSSFRWCRAAKAARDWVSRSHEPSSSSTMARSSSRASQARRSSRS